MDSTADGFSPSTSGSFADGEGWPNTYSVPHSSSTSTQSQATRPLRNAKLLTLDITTDVTPSQGRLPDLAPPNGENYISTASTAVPNSLNNIKETRNSLPDGREMSAQRVVDSPPKRLRRSLCRQACVEITTSTCPISPTICKDVVNKQTGEGMKKDMNKDVAKFTEEHENELSRNKAQKPVLQVSKEVSKAEASEPCDLVEEEVSLTKSDDTEKNVNRSVKPLFSLGSENMKMEEEEFKETPLKNTNETSNLIRCASFANMSFTYSVSIDNDFDVEENINLKLSPSAPVLGGKTDYGSNSTKIGQFIDGDTDVTANEKTNIDRNGKPNVLHRVDCQDTLKDSKENVTTKKILNERRSSLDSPMIVIPVISLDEEDVAEVPNVFTFSSSKVTDSIRSEGSPQPKSPPNMTPSKSQTVQKCQNDAVLSRKNKSCTSLKTVPGTQKDLTSEHVVQCESSPNRALPEALRIANIEPTRVQNPAFKPPLSPKKKSMTKAPSDPVLQNKGSGPSGLRISHSAPKPIEDRPSTFNENGRSADKEDSKVYISTNLPATVGGSFKNLHEKADIRDSTKSLAEENLQNATNVLKISNCVENEGEERKGEERNVVRNHKENERKLCSAGVEQVLCPSRNNTSNRAEVPRRKVGVVSATGSPLPLSTSPLRLQDQTNIQQKSQQPRQQGRPLAPRTINKENTDLKVISRPQAENPPLSAKPLCVSALIESNRAHPKIFVISVKLKNQTMQRCQSQTNCAPALRKDSQLSEAAQQLKRGLSTERQTNRPAPLMRTRSTVFSPSLSRQNSVSFTFQLSPHLNGLPDEALISICKLLSFTDVRSVSQVSRSIRNTVIRNRHEFNRLTVNEMRFDYKWTFAHYPLPPFETWWDVLVDSQSISVSTSSRPKAVEMDSADDFDLYLKVILPTYTPQRIILNDLSEEFLLLLVRGIAHANWDKLDHVEVKDTWRKMSSITRAKVLAVTKSRKLSLVAGNEIVNRRFEDFSSLDEFRSVIPSMGSYSVS